MKLGTNRETCGFRLQASGCRLKLKVCGLQLVACGALIFLLLGIAAGAQPTVSIRKLKDNHFQLIVGAKPYIIKGVCYNPIPIGQNHEYDWWSDPAKPWIVDGKLMQEMGINTVRIYQVGENPQAVRQVIQDLYQLYGIRVILGSWLGFWEYPCPLYGDEAFRERIKKEVLEMVSLYKDEPGILLWVLGNENNYSCLGRVNPWSSQEVDQEPDPKKKNELRFKIYYSFINELACQIHQLDPAHPVALGNGELNGLEFARVFAPDVDLVACIIYRGKTFGNLFRALKATFDKPVYLAEFGADSYDAYLKKEDQNIQAFFLESQWRQIYENLAGNKDGMGNCLGGTSFEWSDEWWKHNEADAQSWAVHDTESNWQNGNYYFDNKDGTKNMNEEWFGLVALSEEQEAGLNKRIPRKAYYVVREFWRNPIIEKKNRKR
jgi:hypothetical protein